jgi:hypothetical protein
MLIWICSEEPCETSCVARNPILMELSTSAVPDNGLWVVEPCRIHAELFEREDTS